MPQQVDLGSPYGVVEFPDSHTPEQIVREFDDLEAARKAAPPPRVADISAGDYVRQVGGRLIRGLGGVAASIPEQLGIAASGLARLTGTSDTIAGEGDPTRAEDRASYQLGQSIRRATGNVVHTRKELDDSFWASKVPEGVGSALGFIGGGLAGRALRIPQWLGISGLGAAAGGSEFYHDAKASGADEGTAQLASVIGSVVGTSEALPLSRIVRRLDGVTGGTFSRAVWEAGKDTLEEALQEGAQSLAQNLTAQQLYDKDRELFNSVAENAGIGGVTGFLLSSVSQAIGIPIGRSRVRREQQERGTARRREAVAQFENERVANVSSPVPIPAATPETSQALPPTAEGIHSELQPVVTDATPPVGRTRTGMADNAEPPNVANAIPTPTASTVVPPTATQTATTPAPGVPVASPEVGGAVSGVAVPAPAVEPAQRAIVEQAITDVSSRWQNGPEIAVVDTADQFPEDVRAEARSRGIDLGRIPAVTDARGKVWLAAAAIPDEARARQLILHEAVGHVGVEAVFGTPQEFTTFMQGVAQRHLSTPLGLETRSLYGADPVTVGKEIVAKLAENPQADPTLWQQIVAAVRNWVRRIFNVEISDNDIQVLLLRGRRNVEAGQPSGAAIRFAISPEQRAARTVDQTWRSQVADPTPGTMQDLMLRGDEGDVIREIESVKSGRKPISTIYEWNTDAIDQDTFNRLFDDGGIKIVALPKDLHNGVGAWAVVRHGDDWRVTRLIDAARARDPVMIGQALGYTQQEIDEFIERAALIRQEEARTGGTRFAINPESPPPSFFRNRANVVAATSNPGLTPSQIQEAEDLAAVQSSMVTADMVNWLVSIPSAKFEIRAQNTLDYLLARATLSPTPRPLSSFPEGTTEEIRTKELAGALQLSHHAVDRETLARIYAEIATDEILMNSAVAKAGKLTATQHKANYLTALFNALTSRHRQYIEDLRAAGPASANVEAQWQAALKRAEDRLNEQDASPIALRNALSAIARTIPESILTAPGATNQDVINWVTQQGALITVVGQNVRDWLLVDDGTGTPALSTYAQLIPDLQTLKDIENNSAVVQADIDAFESWFRNNANSKKVSSQEYAQKYFAFRTGRDRALKIIAASDKEIDRLDTRIRGNIMARDKLEAMMADPAYRDAVREAAEKADTIIVALFAPDAAGKLVAKGLINRSSVGSHILPGPLSGVDYVVDLHPTTGQETQNKENLRAYVAEAEAWALGHTDSDPLLADEYSRLSSYIKKELLHPSYDPKEGFTVTRFRLPFTNIRIPVDIFDGITAATGAIGYSFQTIRDVIERIGGRTVREAFKDADVLDRTMRKVEAIDADPNYGKAAQTQAILKAVASHGWAPDQTKKWDEEIAEPIIASGQNRLSPVYEINDFVVGSDVRITAADLSAIRLMKQWSDAIQAVAPHSIQDRLHDLGISRRAIGNGRYAVHRVQAHWTKQFVEAWETAPNDAAKAKLLEHDDAFRQVVLGYLAEYNTEFARMDPANSKKSPLFDHYRRLADTEKQGVQKFRTWDEVITFLADRMVATGMEADLATARAKAQTTLFGEIKEFIENYKRDVIGFVLTDIYGGVPTEVVQHVGTRNAFTTPRGRLVAPSTFYSYSTATESRHQQHIGNLRSLLNLKLLQSMAEASGSMEKKRTEMEKRIDDLSATIGAGAARRQVQKETAADRELGNIRFDYSQLLTALQSIEQAAKNVRRYELSTEDHYQHAGVAAANNFFSTIKSSLLSSVQSMTTNVFSGALLGPALGHWQAGRFGRAVGDVVFPVAVGKAIMLKVASLVEGNPTMKKLLNQHAPLWDDFAEAVVKASADWRRVQQVAQSAGMVNPYNLGTTLKNMAALKRSGGRIVNDDPHRIAEYVNTVLSAPGVRHATETLKATTPRLLDNFINYVMVIAFDGEMNFLRKVGWAAFKARETAAAGTGRNWQDLTDRTNVLQPGDLGLKTHKALEFYRQLFVPLGSLDSVLLDYYNRTQGMTEEQREAEPLLSTDDHAAMALQYAAKSNVSTETNRPYSLKGKGSDGVWRNVVGTFMGWGINMMHQLSKGMQTHSKDPQFPTIAQSFIGLATIVLLMSAVGAWNWEFGDALTKLAYDVSSARVQPGNVQDWQTAWLYFAQSLVNTVPMIGSSIGGLAGVAYTGRGNPFDLTSLSPHIGFVAGIYNTAKRIAQTGDATLPMLDFTRQWVPMSKIPLNRMPVVQGIVDQQNAVRSMNASAPPGTEIKWGKRGSGDAKYGPANDEIQKLISSAYDAAARGGSIEAVQERMAEAVAAYVAAGRSQPDAMKALSSALSAKEPIRVLTGREMTPEEERRWVDRMTPAQKADYDRATAAWGILGTVTGKNLSMVTAPAGGGGGGGRIPSRAVGLGGGGGSRLGAFGTGGAMPSGFGSIRTSSLGGRRRRTGATRRRRGTIGGRPSRRRSLGPRIGRATTRRRRSLGTRRRRGYTLA